MFKRKKKNNQFDSIEKDINISNKENEIISSYEYEEEFSSDKIPEIELKNNEEIVGEINEEYEEFTLDEADEVYDDYDEYEDEKTKIKDTSFYKKILNIIFIIIIVSLTMITIDVISVARYDVGPFFAIPLNTYKDGGTKEYYGLGYKVIKYKQIQGRRDREIGFYSLKYNAEPVTLKDIDLAIEMTGKEAKTYKKYYKKFVRIVSNLEAINKATNQITLSYKDEGKKYSLDIVCTMATDDNQLKKLELKKETTIIGVIDDFEYKTKNKPNTIYVKNCFAEQ